jgi:hypothetical protein
MVTNFWMQKRRVASGAYYRYNYPYTNWNDPGEYLAYRDANNNMWAVYTDTTGSTSAPTGSIWVSCTAARRGKADISACTTTTEMVTVFKNAFNALSGISTYFNFYTEVIDTVDFLSCQLVIPKTFAYGDARAWLYDDSTSWEITSTGVV